MKNLSRIFQSKVTLILSKQIKLLVTFDFTFFTNTNYKILDKIFQQNFNNSAYERLFFLSKINDYFLFESIKFEI